MATCAAKKIAATARKAGSENEKVDEILFINLMTVENRNQALQARLEESDKRRNQILDKIQARQRNHHAGVEKAAELVAVERERRISTLKDNMERRQREVAVRRRETVERRRVAVNTQEKKSGPLLAAQDAERLQLKGMKRKEERATSFGSST